MAQGELPVVLSAQCCVQTGVQASLPDLPSQLQNHRAAPLVLLLEHRGSAWPCLLQPFTSHSSELGVSWCWASLLSCPPAALLLAPFGSLCRVLAARCPGVWLQWRRLSREEQAQGIQLPWSSPCPGTPGGDDAALEQPCSRGCGASFQGSLHRAGLCCSGWAAVGLAAAQSCSHHTAVHLSPA